MITNWYLVFTSLNNKTFFFKENHSANFLLSNGQNTEFSEGFMSRITTN